MTTIINNKAQVSLPSDTEVRITRDFKAPRTLVWQAHTEPELFQRWIGGYPGWSMPVCEMDVRPGGKYRWRWRSDEEVRLLTPFDPIVWDRRRFEMFWDWAYRFEAYTPPRKRKLGYYALPLLWRERVIGWGNLAVRDGALCCSFGFCSGKAPRDAAFRAGLDAELERMRVFLGLVGQP